MACPSFTLSPNSRSQLAEQVRSNGVFVHSLVGAPKTACNAAPFLQVHLTVEQCGSDVTVQLRLGETVNTITVQLADDTAHRVAQFVEDLAKAFAAVADLDVLLRNAVREKSGRYLLPQSGVDGLGLVLSPANSDPERTIFRFVLNGAGITLPMMLPTDQHQAHDLLSGCVHEIKGWQ